jgi:multidrug efflux pump subunit AcrA (membrane-fusion protein)
VNSRYVFFGAFVFAISAFLSYQVFRHGELKVRVKLAKVEFRDELPRGINTEGQLSPVQKWPVELKRGGKLTRYLVGPGEVVKRDQLIATIDESENKKSLEDALTVFKLEKTNLENAKKKLNTGTLTQKEYDETETKFFASKRTLGAAKDALENSLVLSPAEGRMGPQPFKPGDTVVVGKSIADIEDWSKISVAITVPESESHEIPNHARLSLTPSSAGGEVKPVEAFAEVHAADGKPGGKPTEANLELVIQPDDTLANWRHQTVHLNIPIASLKRVALVDRSALSKDGLSRIPVLNPYGFLHWQSVEGAPTFEDHIVIKGVEPKSFRVVLPENPSLLNQAITLNVRPKVENGG